MQLIEGLEEVVRQAKVGSVVPVHKIIETKIDPVEYFMKISDYGRKPGSILLESAEVIPKYGEQSVGTADPALKIIGEGNNFQITALNTLGERILDFLKGDFDFCDEVTYSSNTISGTLKPQRSFVSEDERLKLKTHMDIIRTMAFKFSPTFKPVTHYGGLFGIFSYDFIDQFEDLPKNSDDIARNPDYEIFLADNVFMFDHSKRQLYLLANALIMDDKNDETYERCLETISAYEAALDLPIPEPRRFNTITGKITTDTSKQEYLDLVSRLKEHVVAGDIFQAVPSRTIIADFNAEPLDVYRELRRLNPSPYMFFINGGDTVLVGSSPERAIGVKGENSHKVVEIRPIAGTKPRGFIGGKIDRDLDGRYEAELKLDPKELAEHSMLIDLARNDIAKIARTGTRHVAEPFVVEKYSHVQHLVSTVRGVLKDDLDPLHAYMACMNMGTLTGAPKVEAMKLLRIYEKNKRGYYGGSVFYLTPSRDFDSAIIIRSMVLKGGKAYIRVGGGIVHDSVPETEFVETENKASACLTALKNVGGVHYE